MKMKMMETKKKKPFKNPIFRFFSFISFAAFYQSQRSISKTNQLFADISSTYLDAPSSTSVTLAYAKSAKDTPIHHVFYFNSFGNPKRYQFMESWLSQDKVSLSIPYERLETYSGDVHSKCFNKNIGTTATKKQDDCVRRMSLTHTYHRFLWDKKDYYNVRSKNSGLTLMIHDDHVKINDIHELWTDVQKGLLRRNISQLDGWDVIGFNCPPQSTLEEDLPKRTKDSAMSTQYNNSILLWQGSGLTKLRSILLKESKWDFAHTNVDIDIDAFLSIPSNSIKMHCFGTNTIEDQAVKEERLNVAVYREEWVEDVPHISLEELKHINMHKKQNFSEQSTKIDRIYFLNMDDRPKRREGTEFMLQHQLKQHTSNIPYKRIPGKRGFTDQCGAGKSGNRCIGVSGIAITLVDMLDKENTTGLSLVLEDDFMMIGQAFQRIEESLKMLPSDWEYARFDCWEVERLGFNMVNEYVIDTSKVRKMQLKLAMEQPKFSDLLKFMLCTLLV